MSYDYSKETQFLFSRKLNSCRPNYWFTLHLGTNIENQKSLTLSKRYCLDVINSINCYFSSELKYFLRCAFAGSLHYHGFILFEKTKPCLKAKFLRDFKTQAKWTSNEEFIAKGACFLRVKNDYPFPESTLNLQRYDRTKNAVEYTIWNKSLRQNFSRIDTSALCGYADFLFDTNMAW